MSKRAKLVALVCGLGLVAAGCPYDHPSRYGFNHDAYIWAVPGAPFHQVESQTDNWGAVRSAALDLAQQADLKWVRVFVRWEGVQPAVNQFNWSQLDAEIAALYERGFSILVSFVGVPTWASDGRSSPAEVQQWGSLDNCPNGDDGNERWESEFAVPPDNGHLQAFPDFLELFLRRFAGKITAVDIWNEPQTCLAWRGSRSEWKTKILGPAFTRLKAVAADLQFPLRVGAPGVNINQVQDYDAWFTHQSGGRAVLDVDLDFVSFHHYGTVTEVKNSIQAKAGFERCNASESYCVSDFWVTEFGFALGNCDFGGGVNSDPGGKAVEVFQQCDAVANCKHAFIWDIWRPAWDENPQSCRYELLQGANLTRLHGKYDAIRAFATGRQIPIGETMQGAAAAVSPPGTQQAVLFAPVGVWDLFYKVWNAGRWGDWIKVVPPPGILMAGSPGASSMAAGEFDVFGIGISGTVERAHYSLAGGWTWSTTDLPGNHVAAVSWGSGRTDLMTLGSDAAFRWKYWDGGFVSTPIVFPIAKQFAFGPALASWGSGRLDAFGTGTDSQVWHAWYAGGNWHGWELRGGLGTSAPAAVSWGPNRIDLFVRGSDNAYYWQLWNGSSWSSWESLGYPPGGFTSRPTAVSRASGLIDLIGRGADGKLYQARCSAGQGGWARVGGAVDWKPVVGDGD